MDNRRQMIDRVSGKAPGGNRSLQTDCGHNKTDAFLATKDIETAPRKEL